MQVNWSELPSLPLENVYSFLDRDDQVNMSLVCRSWSAGFESPSVWSTFNFVLKDSQLSKNPWPGMKFVKKYGKMFRHVSIGGFGLSKDFMNKFIRYLADFFEVLSGKTQIFTVEFNFLSVLFEAADDSAYNDIYGAIASFLSSQHKLRRVEFYSCRFRYQDSVELLRILSANNRMSLAHLYFRKFNRDNESNLNADQNPPSIADFPNLKTLDTDYSLIFEKMIEQQCVAIRKVQNIQSLPPLKLYMDGCSGNWRDVRGLTSDHWLTIKTLYTYLEIELGFRIDDSARQVLQFFILPNMPVSHLHLSSVRGADISEVFHHLLACRTSDYLVFLSLVWIMPIEHLYSTVNPFLLSCQKLKCFKMTLRDPRGIDFCGIYALLKSWLENRPQNLSRVIIDVYLEEKEYDLTSKKNIARYESVLNSLGLNISIHVYED